MEVIKKAGISEFLVKLAEKFENIPAKEVSKILGIISIVSLTSLAIKQIAEITKDGEK